MKQRNAKKKCKRYIKNSGLKIIATHGRTFVVKYHPSFLCLRWYIYTIASERHENLNELIQEGKMPLSQWKERFFRK